jgi:hypothetical protein
VVQPDSSLSKDKESMFKANKVKNNTVTNRNINPYGNNSKLNLKTGQSSKSTLQNNALKKRVTSRENSTTNAQALASTLIKNDELMTINNKRIKL